MKRPACHVLMLILLFITGLTAHLEAAGPIIVDDSLKSMECGSNFEYIEDSDKALTFQNIISRDAGWVESENDSFSFGFTSSVYWMRFTVDYRQVKQKGFYLEISYPMIDEITIYEPNGDGTFADKTCGDRHPFKQRDIMDRNVIFILHPDKGKTTYYLRFETTSSLNFKPVLWAPTSYIERINVEYPMFWMYYGIMVVMFLYILLLSLSTRSMKYVFYSMFIGAYALFQLTLNGLAFQYLWPNWIWWANNSLPAFMVFTIFSAVVFIRSYVESKRNFPVIDRIFLYMGIVPCFIWTVLALVLPYRAAIVGATFLSIFSPLVVYGAGIFIARQSRPARFILIGFGMLVLGVCLFVLKTFGILPANMLTQWSIQIGSSLQIVLLALGLADELNLMKKDLQDLNVNLEHKVEERTRELKMARDALWGEMELAKKIQTVLLPLEPEIPGYDICAYMSPADDVGGDYYDIINVGDCDWLVIGDVSGHGVPAGIIMMMVQTAIHTAISQNPDQPPSKLLAVINKTITDNIRQLNEDKYMTITVFATYRDGVFYFSGLHQDIMIYRSRTGSIELVETTGYWIGIEDNIADKVSDETFQLYQGDTMLVYTDGITEAWEKGSVRDKRDPEIHMFGQDRLERIFAETGSGPLKDILMRVLESLENYDCPDDVTMVIMRRM